MAQLVLATLGVSQQGPTYDMPNMDQIFYNNLGQYTAESVLANLDVSLKWKTFEIVNIDQISFGRIWPILPRMQHFWH